MDNRDKTQEVYELIREKAGTNSMLQGISGWMGFPYTAFVDGAVLYTHYADMLNRIRRIYGFDAICPRDAASLLPGMVKELLFDLMGDKMLGNIPFVGIYFNAICAKTLTWRLGVLFAMLSSAGEEINPFEVRESMKLIREFFPQSDAFFFRQPSPEVFEQLIASAKDEFLYEAEWRPAEVV